MTFLKNWPINTISNTQRRNLFHYQNESGYRDDKAKYTDWSQRGDIKAELKADLIFLLAEFRYPPVDRDEVYKEIFEQAENFKKYRDE